MLKIPNTGFLPKTFRDTLRVDGTVAVKRERTDPFYLSVSILEALQLKTN